MSESSTITDSDGDLAFPDGYYSEQKVDSVFKVIKTTGITVPFAKLEMTVGAYLEPSGVRYACSQSIRMADSDSTNMIISTGTSGNSDQGTPLPACTLQGTIITATYNSTHGQWFGQASVTITAHSAGVLKGYYYDTLGKRTEYETEFLAGESKTYMPTSGYLMGNFYGIFQ